MPRETAGARRVYRSPMNEILHASTVSNLAEPPLNLRKQLGRYLVARVALNPPETSAAVIVLQKRSARFLELPQPLLPCVN